MFLKQAEELLFTGKEIDVQCYFSGNGEKYCFAVVITIMFLCFDVKVNS